MYTPNSIDFDLLNSMEPSIFSKNQSLTSEGLEISVQTPFKADFSTKISHSIGPATLKVRTLGVQNYMVYIVLHNNIQEKAWRRKSPLFRDSGGGSKAFLEQGASYDSSEEHTFSYTRVAKLRFQLREKKKDMLLK